MLINLSPLLKLFNQIATYRDLADSLHTGELTEAMRRPLGVMTGARPALLAALQTDLQRPILFITARADRARIFTEQIQVWTQDPGTIYRLPDPDSLPHEKVAWGQETIQGRLAALAALVLYNNRSTNPSVVNFSPVHAVVPDHQSPPSHPPTLPPSPPLIVTSARALMHRTLPPAEFTLMHFSLGQRIDLNQVMGEWIALGYQPEDVVEVPGSFSRRGGILDIFPPNAEAPVRIELFGDEIDSLRSFDPATQRSDERLQSFIVSPATEALPRYAERAATQLNRLDLTNLQPSAKIALEEDVARLSSGTAFRGIEYYLPFFYNGLSAPAEVNQGVSVLDYLPQNALVFIEDPEELAAVVDELEHQARTLKKDLTNMGDLPHEWPPSYFSWPALARKLSGRQPLVLGFTRFSEQPARDNEQSSTAPDPSSADGLPSITGKQSSNLPTLEQQPEQVFQPPNPPSSYLFQSVFVPPPSFGGQIKNVIEAIVERKKRNERILLVSRQTKRLSHLLEEQANLIVTPGESLIPGDPPPPSGSISLIHGMLIEGWSLRQEAALVTVMSDSELFGWKKPTTIRRRKAHRGVTPETFFADVNPGDLVVHIEHGIGRYVGLVKLDFEGVEREYLAVEYANNDKLYVPIHQADRLARYVGVDEHPPLVSRLGSADWNTVKRRTKKAVEDIARELLEVYAKREVAKGRPFGSDTEWQQEIEDAFPYVETDDQLRAIAEVKKDMEQPKPMDRLICGDVGYGKTEVALRAAFKAVMDGTQVALLAPTTVLAQQHYQTFRQRLAAYPVQIEVLSRFRTKQQQEKTIANLADGTTDIVIGTHRLLQKDVVFKDLGLLVIDEEQRFGVKQKERLKALRTEVDILTLTATPIPRTLHMSLSGVRDLSVIDTPPRNGYRSKRSFRNMMKRSSARPCCVNWIGAGRFFTSITG